MDTPGFTSKVMSPRQLLEEIKKSVHQVRLGPHALVIIIKIDRIPEADVKLLKMLPKLFSTDAPKYAIVIFTHGETLKGQSINRLIRANNRV